MDKTNLKFNILAAILIIVFCLAMTPVTFQNDTFYTIKIGEYIMENGITGVDPFSWHEGLKYTFPHWAYDVLIYQIYNIGGFQGIYISTVLFSCILGLCIYFISVKLNKNRVLSFVITMISIYLLRDYIAARAQLVTFILFIFEIYSIEKFLQTKKKRYAIYLVLMSIAIANLHVAVWPFYFVLFLPYIGEFVVYHIGELPKYILTIKKEVLRKNEENAEKVQKIESKITEFERKRKLHKEKYYKISVEKNDAVKWLIVVLIICILAGFITPLGLTPFTYLYKTMQGNTTQNINEHLPLTLYQNIEFMAVIVVFLAILTCTDTKIKLKDLLFLCGLLFLSFASRRQTSMFILVGGIILVRLIQEFLNKYDKNVSEFLEKLFTTVIGGVLLSALVLGVSYHFGKPKIGNVYVDENTYPVYASEYILNNLDLKNIKLYNEYNYGSYLLFKGVPVFIDSRADLYAPEFNGKNDIFSDFLNISNIGTYYEDKFEEYGITHVIVYKNAKLNMFISRNSNYLQLYSDDSFCIYERLKGN